MICNRAASLPICDGIGVLASGLVVDTAQGTSMSASAVSGSKEERHCQYVNTVAWAYRSRRKRRAPIMLSAVWRRTPSLHWSPPPPSPAAYACLVLSPTRNHDAVVTSFACSPDSSRCYS
ncbi:hypothetical protein L227DRAFT_577592 [Lentinus tigrinus ALCF2SS1-6]|uniref:Uncharacterized protein n=1 Tax=Lentinus tigrinus ALCF2SS1-6 TaxID=1328759 RepID=A0A5C2S9A8_9APHY|nr:hypothetical protein L227DRAFT_577592 [Lentinus tigrinus ALCF2SS1-6]